MITTVLVAGPGGSVAAKAVRLAGALVGAPPDHVLTLPADRAAASAALVGSDVVVVASAVVAGGLDGDLRLLLERLATGSRLSGVVAFAVTVGEWPAGARVVDGRLRPALQAAGATSLAPGLHLTRSPDGPDPVLDTYAAFWAPAMGALVGLSRAPQQQRQAS